MERKLAQQFIDGDAKNTQVMLVPPDILYLFNEKGLAPGKYKNIDSAKFFNSQYVQYLSDSIFLESYFKSFVKQSEKYGLSIFFPNDINGFLETTTASYIVRFSQMELMEDTGTYRINEKIDFVNRTKKIVYNMIVLSTWFDISMKDSVQNYTYFDEQFIADEIFGEYIQEAWNYDFRYEYTQYEIEEKDIYEFAQGMGKTHAGYLFDLIMNSYIWNQLPEEKRAYFNYLHYNPEYHSIEVAEEAFIMMDDKN